MIGVSSGAFVGSCAAFALIMVITNGMSESPSRILLAGIAGTQLFNAMTAYVVSTSANAEQSRSVMFWLLGSLSGVRWPDALLALAVTLAGLLVVLLFHGRWTPSPSGMRYPPRWGFRLPPCVLSYC